MDTVTSLAVPVPAKHPGRPWGSKNYMGISHIARRMKEKGIRWVDELIDSYMLYKSQLEAYKASPKTAPQPDAKLLEFWMEILPYVSVKMIERETRGERPKRKFKPKITKAALERLAEAEGRTI